MQAVPVTSSILCSLFANSTPLTAHVLTPGRIINTVLTRPPEIFSGSTYLENDDDVDGDLI